MASSKKTDSSKRGSSKSTAQVAKGDNAVVIDVETTPDLVTEQAADVEMPGSGDAPEVAEVPADDAPLTEKPEQQAGVPEAPVEDPVREDHVSAAPVEQKGSSFLPMVLGGIIAGAIGFGVSQLNIFEQDDAGITTQLRSDLNTQQERLVALEIAEPAVTADLGPIEAQLERIEARLVALEERPVVVVPEGVDAAAAYAAELEALKSSVDTQRNEIEELLSNARTVEQATADAARTASAQTAIAKIVSALDTGQPFGDAVADLQALDLRELDPALAAVAAEGVLTLSTLQADFPKSARAALATARANSTGEGQQGLGGFLTRSLGARSVTPREGDDADAVLSRAEAAVNSGDLATALTELDSLPEEAQAAIADWRAAADARVSVRTAADALAQRLTAD